jgi:dimethylaniline monooxygenase (N-oxide forming)
VADEDRDEVTMRIEAPAEHIYDLVSDVSQMGRWSPECTGGRWLGKATGPAVGARFRGSNRRGWVRWSTVNEVVAADPGREFAFETKQSGTRWGYRLEPDGDGTLVTEWREPWRDRPKVAAVFANLLLGGGEAHEDELRDGMRHTLERVKAAAEG